MGFSTREIDASSFPAVCWRRVFSALVVMGVFSTGLGGCQHRSTIPSAADVDSELPADVEYDLPPPQIPETVPVYVAPPQLQQQLDPRTIEVQSVEQLPRHIFSLERKLAHRRRAFLSGGGYRRDSLGVTLSLRPRRLEVDPGFLSNAQLSTVEYVITSIADADGRTLPLTSQAKRKRKLIYHDRGNPKRTFISLEEIIQPGQAVAKATIEFEYKVPIKLEIFRFRKGDAPGTTKSGAAGSVSLKSLDQSSVTFVHKLVDGAEIRLFAFDSTGGCLAHRGSVLSRGARRRRDGHRKVSQRLGWSSSFWRSCSTYC